MRLSFLTSDKANLAHLSSERLFSCIKDLRIRSILMEPYTTIINFIEVVCPAMSVLREIWFELNSPKYGTIDNSISCLFQAIFKLTYLQVLSFIISDLPIAFRTHDHIMQPLLQLRNLTHLFLQAVPVVLTRHEIQCMAEAWPNIVVLHLGEDSEPYIVTDCEELTPESLVSFARSCPRHDMLGIRLHFPCIRGDIPPCLPFLLTL